MKKAMFWTSEDDCIRCHLCARKCHIKPGETGICGVRKNIDGELKSLVFGRPCSISVDSIEKKPFYHFAPGTETLSIATVGCNFFCKYCQNIEISHPEKIFGDRVLPEQLAEQIKQQQLPGFSWTYTEPTVFTEYFWETAKAANKINDFYNTWVTNGYTTKKVIKKLAKHIDAVNIDYKGNAQFYKDICKAELEPVRQAIKLYKKLGVHIEITNLLVTNRNDSTETIKEMVSWIVDNLGKDTPLHISRYHPYHKLKEPPTPLDTLEKAYKIARKQLNFVYLGNVTSEKTNTYCPDCGKLLIKRTGTEIEIKNLQKNENWHCTCGREIPLAGMKWVEK